MEVPATSTILTSKVMIGDDFFADRHWLPGRCGNSATYAFGSTFAAAKSEQWLATSRLNLGL